MIAVTRLNRAELVLNSDLIETIEVTPDTVITLITGQKIVVRENSGEVLEKIRVFRESFAAAPILPNPGPARRKSSGISKGALAGARTTRVD